MTTATVTAKTAPTETNIRIQFCLTVLLCYVMVYNSTRVYTTWSKKLILAAINATTKNNISLRIGGTIKTAPLNSLLRLPKDATLMSTTLAFWINSRNRIAATLPVIYQIPKTKLRLPKFITSLAAKILRTATLKSKLRLSVQIPLPDALFITVRMGCTADVFFLFKLRRQLV